MGFIEAVGQERPRERSLLLPVGNFPGNLAKSAQSRHSFPMEIRGVTSGRAKNGVLSRVLGELFTLKNTALMAAIGAIGALAFVQFIGREHPYFKYSETWVPQGYFPPADKTDEKATSGSPPSGDWSVQAFFYALGAWPVRFDTRPIFFTLPYEKGPPYQFIGKIHARWEMPDIQFTWEGPKTPRHLGAPLSVLEIEECFSQTTTLLKPNCYRKRQSILSRHKTEIEENLKRARAPIRWSVQWFEVDNPLLPLSERPKGVYFSGQTVGSLNIDLAEDRIILVLPNGIQQTLILQRPVNSRGDLAKALFELSVRSLRIFPRLDEGRLWAVKELKRVHLQWKHESLPKPLELAENISRAHLRLLSKLSVDPANREAYFHLGGTSGFLARSLRKAHTQNREYLLQESSAIAKPNTLSALAYSKDLELASPTTSGSYKRKTASANVTGFSKIDELQKMADEVKRY